jgi:hypothetical protein
MQSGIGAFYFAPQGTQGIQALIPPGNIAIKDNFEVLAGLQILRNTLLATEQTPKVIESLRLIDVMLEGGVTLNGFRTNGLLSFLLNGAFDKENGVFFTSGTSLIPSSQNDWRPSDTNLISYLAVTTNLWAISSLGVANIDAWFGEGTALNIWLAIRQNGAYFNEDDLWGVGYSLVNNLGMPPESIMTTEGTAAAINALNVLIDFYGEKSGRTNLVDDLNALQTNVFNLRNDRYLSAKFQDATPSESFTEVPESMGQAFLYASKRLPIPLDWNANTLASINANAWIIMNNYEFNPFQFSGRLSGENYSTPPTTDILDSDLETPAGALPKSLLVRFSAGDLRFRRLAIRYNMDGSNTNWIIAVLTNESQGTITLPQGTKSVSISLVNGIFANACEINPATDLCVDETCMTAKRIIATWSSSGLGSCDLRS